MVMTTESVNMVDEMDVWSEIDLATTGSSEGGGGGDCTIDILGYIFTEQELLL